VSREAAIARAHAYYDDGGFLADLTRRVAIPSSSQENWKPKSRHGLCSPIPSDVCLGRDSGRLYLRSAIPPQSTIRGSCGQSLMV